MKKEIITDCTLCYHSCGCVVEVEDGKAKKIKGLKSHPLNRGKLCPKGANALELIYSDKRIKNPLKKVNGEFKEISWDVALDEISEKILDLKSKYGSDSLAFFCGSIGVENYEMFTLIHLLQSCLESPNFFSVESVCYRMRIQTRQITFGKYLVEEMDSNLYILWGHNPHQSDMPLRFKIEENIKKGAKLVVIDPKKIEFADKADLFLQIKPGTDVALGLAVAKIIIEENLYDKEFVKKYTYGFEKFKEHIKKYSIEWAENITGIKKDKIYEFAKLYASTKGASIYQGTCTQDQQINGVQASRIFAILQTITGNINTKGGWVETPFPRLNFPTKKFDKIPTGIKSYPFYSKKIPFGVSSLIPKLIPDPIKFFLVMGGNPLITMPDSKAFKESFEKLELLVVHDLFLSETAKLAHYVLPAASHLEKWGVAYNYSVCHSVPYILLRKKCIEPLYNSWPEWKFISELAKKLELKEYFPWESEEEYVNFLLQPTGLTLDYLLNEKPEGLFFAQKEYNKEKRFKTSTGKIEIYSEAMKNIGMPPLPEYRAETIGEGELLLSIGHRNIYYTHSQHRQSPTLKKLSPEPFAEISKNTAEKYNIEDGDIIYISTNWGKIKMKAKVSDKLLDDVVLVPHGWEGDANGNLLTTIEELEPYMGYPIFKALKCKIYKEG